MLTSPDIAEWMAYLAVKGEHIEEAQRIARVEAEAKAMSLKAARR